MIHKKVNKILIMVLVCIMLFNFTVSPVVNAEPVTLATAWGGTVIAKEVLALVIALAGAGVTLATQDDAWNMYHDLKDNNQSLLNEIISVQPQIWTGYYNEVTQDLNNIKDGITTWLTGIFDELNIGQNIYSDTGMETANFGANKKLVGLGNNYLSYGGYGVNIEVHNDLTLGWILNVYDLYGNISYRWVPNPTWEQYWIYVTIYNDKFTIFSVNTQPYPQTIIYSKQLSNVSEIDNTNSLSATITADAPVLDGDYDAETDRRYLPPPWLGRYPAIEPKIKDIPTATGGTQKVYDGDIDEYLEDITNNATWSDIDEYIKTGANTTTLTPTAEGTLEVGEVITDGLPYPNVGTDAPIDVLTGIGGITGLLQGLTNWLANIANTISNIFSIPADLTLNFDSLRLLNFKDKFPFSIPWDIYRAIAVFAQGPQDPELAINLDTDYINVQHQINLSAIDLPLRFARYAMSIFFILFLATKTRDLIKW